jgi:AcrR family transcriptional regulator
MKKQNCNDNVESPEKISLRERQTLMTRNIILDGVGRVIEEGGLDDLTFEAVADASGVSLRTIFRYFPTKDDLLAAFWTRLNETTGITSMPASAEELAEGVVRWFEVFGAREKLFKEYMRSRIHAGQRPKLAAVRRETIDACLKDNVKGVDARTSIHARAVAAALFSGNTWATIKDVYGLNGKEAGEAVSWAIRLIINALEKEKSRHSQKPSGEK